MEGKRGGRNKGFWYRSNRDWCVGEEKLLDAEGNHIKGKDNRQSAEQAYHAVTANGKPETKLGRWQQHRHYVRLGHVYLRQRGTKGTFYFFSWSRGRPRG